MSCSQSTFFDIIIVKGDENMDMQKIGAFLKNLRKEKGLTQEQLAEIFGVAGRTVSRWENASNMPDLSMIIQIADFFDVEVKEILNGERDDDKMNQETKEMLEKVADYNKIEKEKRIKTFVTSFLATIIVGVIILNIQLIMYLDIKYIAGEAIIILVGSITAVVMTIRDGLWGKPNRISAIKNDIITSGAMAALFSIVAAFLIYKFTNNIQRSVICAVSFFFVIYIIGFVVLRILAWLSNKKLDQTLSGNDVKVDIDKDISD